MTRVTPGRHFPRPPARAAEGHGLVESMLIREMGQPATIGRYDIRARDRPRNDGRRLRGPRHRARPDHRPQGHPARLPGGPPRAGGVRAAVLRGGADRGPPLPSEHRGRARRRPRRRVGNPVHRPRAPGGPAPRRRSCPRALPCPGRGAAHRAAGGGSPAPRARAGGRAPGRQARQHRAPGLGRAEDPRLRHRRAWPRSRAT